MKKKINSTYDKFIENKKQKRLLDREYMELLSSELLLAASKEDNLSTIQSLRPMHPVSIPRNPKR